MNYEERFEGLKELDLIGDTTADALAEAGYGPEDLLNYEISKEDIVEAGVSKRNAGRIESEYGLREEPESDFDQVSDDPNYKRTQSQVDTIQGVLEGDFGIQTEKRDVEGQEVGVLVPASREDFEKYKEEERKIRDRLGKLVEDYEVVEDLTDLISQIEFYDVEFPLEEVEDAREDFDSRFEEI